MNTLNGKKCGKTSGNYLKCADCRRIISSMSSKRSLCCDDENGKKTKIHKVEPNPKEEPNPSGAWWTPAMETTAMGTHASQIPAVQTANISPIATPNMTCRKCNAPPLLSNYGFCGAHRAPKAGLVQKNN